MKFEAALFMLGGVALGYYALTARLDDIAIWFIRLDGVYGPGEDGLSLTLMALSAKLMLAIYAAALLVMGAIFLAKPPPPPR